MVVYPSGVPESLLWVLVRGGEVFPVRGKEPLTTHGFKSASTDPAQWARWAAEFPGCGWAAPTGEINGFDVLDADTPEAVTFLERQLPLGPRVRTGRGGMHFYLVHAPSARNWAKRLPGTDFRGEGGYVVLAGSIHENGQPYEWVEGTADLQIPDTPAWVLDLHLDVKEGRTTGTRYLEGERNDRLFRVACAVRAKGGDVAEQTARANDTLCSPPLAPDEIARVVESALRYPVGPSPPTPALTDLWVRDENRVILKASLAAFVDAILALYTFVTIEDTEELLVFESGFYRPHARQLVYRWVERQHAKERRASTLAFRREVYEAVRARSYAPRETLNPPGFLALANGLLDLTDPAAPKFGPHDSSVRLTFGLPVEYRPGADSPAFHAFLHETQPDVDVRLLLQEEAGYVLIPGNPHKIAFFWVGVGDSGKSTFQSILRGVYGPRNVTAVSLQSLADNRFAAAGLYGKLANLYADLPSKMIREIGLFKMLTGGTDEVPAEKKFQPAFSFVNNAKLFFSANEMPPVPSADDAFYRRWVLTVFRNRIPIERQDTALAARIVREEGPGILNWMIEGLVRLSARGRFNLTSTTVETGKTWRRLSDSLSWYVESEVVPSPGDYILKADFYARYTSWCADREVDPRTVREVGLELPRMVAGLKGGWPKPSGKGTKSVVAWMGIRLRGPEDPPIAVSLDSYTMPSGGVEPMEPVEPDGSGSIGSTGSTGKSGMSEGDPLAASREELDRLEEDLFGGCPTKTDLFRSRGAPC